MKRVSFLLACALAGLAFPGHAADWPAGFTVPESTLSPDGRLGVLVPDADHYDEAHPQNKLVEVATGRVLTLIQAGTGMEHMNHGGTAPQWSADGQWLLWKVEGKWSPRALVLLRIAQGKVAGQTNILKEAQQATLARARAAQPKAYAAAKEYNKQLDRSSYPDGFTINVTTPVDDGKPVAVPLAVHAELNANPKAIDDFPKAAKLDATLDGVVTADGKFVVHQFSASH